MAREKRTIQYIYEKKAQGEKMPRTVLYDYTMATLAETAGIDIINVGDSIASIVFGYDSTIPAELDIMIEHAKAVKRGAPTAFVMGDMPFLSYQISIPDAIRNAGRYLKEANVDAVKIEGGVEIANTIRAITDVDIPVIAHTGLTPQSIKAIGSYKTQGRDAESAYKLINEVKVLEEAGAVAIVLECVPSEVARIIYERTNIPILGTGVGPYNDSPMINIYDLLGFFDRNPKFAKKYTNIKDIIITSVQEFVGDVSSGKYPGEEHCYHMLSGEEKKLLSLIGTE